MIKENNILNIQKLCWKDIRLEVCKVNPALAAEIDQLSPEKNHALIKARYSWGSFLLDNGHFYLPDKNGGVVDINHPVIPEKLRKKLFYNNSIPLGIVLNKSIEFHMQTLDRNIPYHVMNEGDIFGLSLSLTEDKSSHYIDKINTMTAGTHSLIMLPKISDVKGYKNLKKEFRLNSSMPVGLNQSQILLEIFKKSHQSEDMWFVDVLYFTGSWIDDGKMMNYRLFREFLFSYAWEKNSFLRDQSLFNRLFSSAINHKNLKPNLYLLDTARHLCYIAMQHYPGFKIAVDDTVAPVSLFKEIFTGIYGLKYIPTMVHPCYLESSSKSSIYYSLEVPTIIDFSTKSKKIRNKLDDLREIKYILTNVIEYFDNNFRKSDEVFFQNIKKMISLEYFHNDEDKFGQIKLSDELIYLDKDIKKEVQNNLGKSFCKSSLFFRGCIQFFKK